MVGPGEMGFRGFMCLLCGISSMKSDVLRSSEMGFGSFLLHFVVSWVNLGWAKSFCSIWYAFPCCDEHDSVRRVFEVVRLSAVSEPAKLFEDNSIYFESAEEKKKGLD